MAELWDRPPFPRRGNRSQRVLFEAIGRALMAWEEVEVSLSHIYSAMKTESRFDDAAAHEYGAPNSFWARLTLLEQEAQQFFRRRPHQDREAEFCGILRLARGYAGRRNDIAHAVVRHIHWQIDLGSPVTLLSIAPHFEWCVVPPDFRGNKFTKRNRPLYVFTSRELSRFAGAFWEIQRKATILGAEIARASPYRPTRL